MTITEDQLSLAVSQSGLTATEKTYISKQSALFEKQRSQLLQDYLNQWILFENNQVLDADFDYKTLLERVKKTREKQIILIKKVEPLNIQA